MKALFSHWGDPGRTLYPSESGFLSSVALAVCEASEYYDTVLYADPKNAKTFAKLKLPLERLEPVDFTKFGVHESLWSFPKFVAMDREDLPFVHMDNDFFLFGTLPDFDEALFSGSYRISENDEQSKSVHENTIEQIEYNDNLAPRPDFWNPENDFVIQCAVIGLKNQKWKDGWVRPVKEWMTETEDEINDNIEGILRAVIFEQFTAGEFHKRYGGAQEIGSEHIYKQPDDSNNFVTLPGSFKRKNEKGVIEVLKRRHPSVHERVVRTAKT